MDDASEVHPLPERFVLTAEPADVAERLRTAGAPRALLVAGALPQRFLDGVVPQVRRSRDTLTVVVSDATRLFLADRGVGHYARGGVELRVLEADRPARADGQPGRAAVAQLRVGTVAGGAGRGDPGRPDLRRAAPVVRGGRGDARGQRGASGRRAARRPSRLAAGALGPADPAHAPAGTDGTEREDGSCSHARVPRAAPAPGLRERPGGQQVALALGGET